jgi:hypothetical protein
MTSRGIFESSLRILLEEAHKPPRGHSSSWKFAFIARRGLSFFLNRNADTEAGFTGSSLDMASGARELAKMADIGRAARTFSRNKCIRLYIGPAVPVDEIARRLYANIPKIPDICQVACDRPADIGSDRGLREHTDVVFAGFDNKSDAFHEWLSEQMPELSQHWCTSRFYQS